MADYQSNMINFWDVLHDQAAGKKTYHKYNSYNHQPRHHSEKFHDTGDRVLKSKDGTYKTYSGSDDTSPDNHSSSGNFVVVPTNDLNVMDYPNYKGIPFVLTNNNINRVEYRLGTSDIRNVSQKNGNTPYSSINVTLQPQRAKDRNGKPLNHKDGTPIFTTARGGWIRFSQGKTKWKGNSLIRMIKDINNTNDDRFAYKELADMVKNYGSETKFDPLDKHMSLPRSSQNNDFTHTMVHQGIVKNNPSQSHSHHFNSPNPYQIASKFSQHFLNDTKIGEDALKYLHKVGLKDDYIKNNYIGYFPNMNSEHKPYNFFSDAFQSNNNLRLGIKSRLISRDKNGNFQDRLKGLFIQPNIKNGEIVGINGFNKDGHRVQALKNEGIARHPDNYSIDPLRNDYNDENPNFTDPGRTHNSHDKLMAMRYLHQKRGLRKITVNELMNKDLIRTSPGIKKNFYAEKDILKTRASVNYLKANKQKLINDKSFGGSKEYHKELFSKMSHLHNKQLNNKAHGFPSYFEFPQKMPRNDQHLHAEDQKTVGADRIQFDPNRDDFTPSDAKFDKNGHNIGGRGKRIVKNGMKNFGYNITCGADKSSKQRKLFIFESPIDALSYIDIHARYLNSSKVPCDFLSLSGSGSKTKTVSNYINHRLKGTDQHYNKIYLGTDNDRAGQQFITEYTLAARKYMPKKEVDNLFQPIVPPAGKDWNDTMQQVRKNGYHYQFQDNKVNYSMDEFKDKVVRDNVKYMSREGLSDALQINGVAKKAYTDFENKGENPRAAINPKFIHQIKNTYKRMSKRDPKDAKIYTQFSHGIGRTLSAVEIDRSLKHILSNSQNLGRDVDNQMAFADHEKKYSMKNQNNSELFAKQHSTSPEQNASNKQTAATEQQNTVKDSGNNSNDSNNNNEETKQKKPAAEQNFNTHNVSVAPKGMSGKEYVRRFKARIRAKQAKRHQDAKKFNQKFNQKEAKHQKVLADKKKAQYRKNQIIAKKNQNNNPTFK